LSRLTLDFRRVEAGASSLLWGEKPLLEAFRPEVLLEDGTRLTEGDHDGLEVKLHSEKAVLSGHVAVLLTLELSRSRIRGADGAADREQDAGRVKVAAFNLLSGVLPGALGRNPYVFRNGWQSWSFTGAWPVARPDPDSSTPVTQTGHGKPGRPVPPPERAVWSDWVTVIDRDDTADHPWLALGFITGRRQFGEFEMVRALREGSGPTPEETSHAVSAERGAPDNEGEATFHLTACSLADGRPLAPGETLRSETLAVIAGEGDPWPALEALAEETGRRAWTEAGRPEGPPREAPTGWCTWYHYFDGISEEVVLADLERLSELGPRLPLKVFQIDDGYQAAIGDWLETNARFPRGMKRLAGRVREAGFEPGLWLAPFSVRSNSRIYQEHPGWVIRDEAGAPVPGGDNWGGPFYGLDVTNPEVEEHLRSLFRTVVREWGYRYLKLDFIYCASLPGRRHDPRCTRAEALRRGLEIIRDEVPEAYVLGCGSPLTPAAGLVDAMRIGPDVAPYWLPPEPLAGDISFPATVYSLRNVFARAFTHGRLWVNDPDCLLVRDQDTQLTADEVRTLATGLACSGGALVLSDGLEDIPEKRLDIARRVLPPSGRIGRPVRPLEETLPSAVVVPPAENGDDHGDDRGAGGAGILTWTAALFNWSDEPAAGRPLDLPGLLRHVGARLPSEDEEDHHEPPALGPDGYPRPKGELAWHVFDFWAGRYVGRFTEDVAGRAPLPEIPAHGSAVLGLAQHKRNVPMVVGSDRHLIQGPPFVSQERSEDDLALTVRTAPGGLETARVWVAVPVPFRLTGARLAGRAAAGGDAEAGTASDANVSLVGAAAADATGGNPEPGAALEPVDVLDFVWGRVFVYEVPVGRMGSQLTLRFSHSEVTYQSPSRARE